MVIRALIRPGTHTCCICGQKIAPTFQFPNPNRFLERFNKWKKAVNSRHTTWTNEEIFQRSFVCITHFKQEDFEGEHMKLLKTAVPCQNLCGASLDDRVRIDVSESDAISPSVVTQTFSTPPKEFAYYLKSIEYSPRTKSPIATAIDQSNIYHSSTSECVHGSSLLLQQFGITPLPGHEEQETSKEPRPSTSTQVETYSPITLGGNFISSQTVGTKAKCLRGKSQKREGILRRLGIHKGSTALSSTELALYQEVRRLQKRISRITKTGKSNKAAITAAIRLRINPTFEKMCQNLTPLQKRFFESHLFNKRKETSKSRRFTCEQKADAIAIWKSGPKTYKFLSKIFVLPSVATLKAILNKVFLQPGISKPIFEVLKRQVMQTGGVIQRKQFSYCNILFDEMAHLDYLPHEDRIIGFKDDGFGRTQAVADHVCVFMLRGIFQRWKQPVAFAFTKNGMKAEVIVKFMKHITKEATEAGLHIVASICDQGGTNSKAINLLLDDTERNILSQGGAYTDDVIILNSQKITPLFDPPHLLKSLRNNLLTKDLCFIHNGKQLVASWKHIISTYEIDRARGSLRSMYKLTDNHVVRHKIHKMKVSLCAQVFSNSVASFINLAAGANIPSLVKRLPAEAIETAELLKLIDNIFDSVNGGFGQKNVKALRGMVGTKTAHCKLWIQAKRVFQEMQFIKSNPRDRVRPPCLLGWTQTLSGFLTIKDSLQKAGFYTFPTRAFNQDPLENFYGQIRQYACRNTHPTCNAFVSFYKSLFVRNLSSYHSSHSNCEADVDSLLVSSQHFLRQANLQRNTAHDIGPSGSDRWRLPTTFSSLNIDIDYFDANVVSYVGGFVLKCIEVDTFECSTCLHNLQHLGEPDPFFLKLVTLKEHDSGVLRLRYLKVDVIKTLIKLYNLLKMFLPTVLHALKVRQRLQSYVQTIVQMDFDECAHVELVKDKIFTKFVKLYIFSYVKHLNRIIIGKEDPQNPNAIESTLKLICEKHRKFRTTKPS